MMPDLMEVDSERILRTNPSVPVMSSSPNRNSDTLIMNPQV